MNEPCQSRKTELSVVVAVVSDAKHLEGCLKALSQQVDPPAMQIIVPYDGRDNDIRSLESYFPDVLFYPVDNLRSMVSHQRASREHHDELRAIGLRLARGDVVTLIEDHGRADRYWSKHIMDAHKNSYAAIGGAIENEVDRLLNWAIFFCDFGRYQNPVKEGPSNYLSDANISYKRRALDTIQEEWQDAFHETSVNAILSAQKEILWLSPKIVINQHRENLRFITALQERYVWGRSYAGTFAQEISMNKRIIYLALTPALPLLLLARKFRDVVSKKRLVGVFIRAFPLTLLLTLFWSIGEFVGYATASPTKSLPKN